MKSLLHNYRHKQWFHVTPIDMQRQPKDSHFLYCVLSTTFHISPESNSQKEPYNWTSPSRSSVLIILKHYWELEHTSNELMNSSVLEKFRFVIFISQTDAFDDFFYQDDLAYAQHLIKSIAGLDEHSPLFQLALHLICVHVL